MTFLAKAPPINGVLDASKAQLPVRHFPHTFKMDPANPTVSLSYRLAYGADFLYLLVQMEAETFVCRDRGYQHGDGLTLTLATPHPENAPTDEFYLLAFWPQDDPLEPVGKFVWGYNGDWPFWRFGPKTRFVVKTHQGNVNFELLLPWEEVHPYHPWLSESIGFELGFANAVGDDQENYHVVVMDDLGKLLPGVAYYTQLVFEKPALDHGAQTYLMLARNGQQGNILQARSATLATEPFDERLLLRIVAGEGRALARREVDHRCNPGLTIQHHDFDTAGLAPGGYRVQWRSQANSSQGEIGLSILPPFELDAQRQRLERVQDTIATGTLHTLQFFLQNLEEKLDRLAIHEICPDLRIELMRYLDLVNEVERGQDVLVGKTGFFRRAFRSELDQTLQPYTIRIPEDFTPEREYPLVVFLHGSDRDDTSVVHHGAQVGPDDFIVLAPFGRGMTNHYVTDDAQQDIQEAIQDVCRHYPIDTDRIVLIGFSMGGYGVYRTHYETPDRFRALAVFSGMPNLAIFYFPDKDHPNFLQDAYQEPFKEVPMFVFHGAEDRNAPFDLTVQAVEKLRAAGAQVEFYVQEGAGHDLPDKEATQAYCDWLARVAREHRR